MSSRPLMMNAAVTAISVAPRRVGDACGGLPASITTLRPASGHDRAERIRDVVDAFRRLRESVARFNRMFATRAGEQPARAENDTALQPLLTTLARHIDPASFARHRELKRAIRDARRLDKTREALFSDAFCLDTEAMRKTAAELDRLDTAFVGLCVEHVLAQHEQRAQTPGAAPAV
ncbi:hypothetical protein [Paraburkholderia bannensis]|uniref:hypothetical protein n=1 Tax=Paraburkholderia bannensis TaxID=765414 RepID=UPI002AC35A18|nr:hypothetical protein [Paraburkholderia bannensis]